EIIVPQIMMHSLEMPDAFACPGVKRYQAVSKQVTADPVGAVKIIGRGSNRQVYNAPFGVNGHLTPDIRSSHVVIRVLWPGVITVFAVQRDSVKGPFLFAGHDVIGSYITRRRKKTFTGRRPHDDEVFVNDAGHHSLNP